MTRKVVRKQVIQRELAWHEEQAHLRYSVDSFLYDPPAFDVVVESAVSFLQVERHELVLDVGCGEGKEILELASRGICVVGTDLSYSQLVRARERIGERSLHDMVSLVQANAEELPFASGSLSIIHGKAILHHLDLDISAREVDRVLGFNGRAVFAEPLARHPVFWLARRMTPRLRTKDEQPLLLRDLEGFAKGFRLHTIDAHFLFAPGAYLFRVLPRGERLFRRAHSILSRIDRYILSRFEELHTFAWYGTIKIEKHEARD